MKKIIALVAVVAVAVCGCYSGVEIASPEPITDNTAESVADTNTMLYYVEDRPEIVETAEVKSNSEIMIEIMNELETNFKNSGFDVVRDSVNHITIK